jgi:hypothetical protein
MKNVITLGGLPYQIIREVWVGKFIDNVNGGKLLNELVELWKEYTESDYVYQNGERVLFLRNIQEIEFTEILEEETQCLTN